MRADRANDETGPREGGFCTRQIKLNESQSTRVSSVSFLGPLSPLPLSLSPMSRLPFLYFLPCFPYLPAFLLPSIFSHPLSLSFSQPLFYSPFLSSLSYGRARAHRDKSQALYVAFNEIAFNMQYTIMLTAHPPAGLYAPPAAKKQFFQQPSAIAGCARLPWPRAAAPASSDATGIAAATLANEPRASPAVWQESSIRPNPTDTRY